MDIFFQGNKEYNIGGKGLGKGVGVSGALLFSLVNGFGDNFEWSGAVDLVASDYREIQLERFGQFSHQHRQDNCATHRTWGTEK